MKTIAVTPARGGSESIPLKNIAPVAGRPLIAYTIDAARASTRIDRHIIYTDHPEIARIARQEGADIPFMRPAEHLGIGSLRAAVLAVKRLEATTTERCDAIVLLHATTPLRTADDIDQALQLLETTPGAASVVSFCEATSAHPNYMYLADPPGSMALTPLLDDGARWTGRYPDRQSFPTVYLRNGAIYAAARDTFLAGTDLCGPGCVPYLMPVQRSVNIDEPGDRILADALLRHARSRAGRTMNCARASG